MKRTVLLLVLMLVLLTATTVYGQEVLSRGEFADLLVEAAGLESALSSAELLVQRGIMKGYPDGELHLERGITRLEALVLAAKTLGLTDAALLPIEGELPLNKEHWGYVFYSWFAHFELTDGDPLEVLTRGQGEAFLKKVFSVDPEATAIMEEVQKKTEKIETMRSVVCGDMNMFLRPGAEETEGMSQMEFKMEIAQEMVLPGSMHQVSAVIVHIPGLGEQELSSEMYLVDGKMYQQLPLDPETGEMQWVRYPEELFPNLEEMISVENPAGTPAGWEDYFNRRLLGTLEIGGEKVYKVATYGRVDDLGQFLESFKGQLGNNQQMQGLLEQGLALVDSMSFWSIEYIDIEDYFTKGADLFFIITLAEEFAGMPNPIEALQMQMKIKEISYNEEIIIELPEEAQEASLLEIPELFPSDGEELVEESPAA